jgi:hypothetical protein
MARKMRKGSPKGETGTVVIEVGHRQCPPIVRTGFKTMAAAHAWLRQTHCTGDCKDNGGMVIGFSDSHDYTAVRFCTPR